jgi:Ca2+-binding EF-hand superfamily protein
MNDSLSGEDSSSIIHDLDSDDDGYVGFEDFWNWYKAEQGLMDSDS